VPAVHTAVGPSAEFVGDDGAGWAVPARRAPLLTNGDYPDLAGPGYVHEVDIEALAETLRAAAADPAERRRRGATAVGRAREYHWGRTAEIVDASLTSLAAEGLPLARDIVPVRPETRVTAVLYVADWKREEDWEEVLVRWAAAVPADADVTLVLPVPEDAAATVLDRIVDRIRGRGLDPERLPDLVLHPHDGDDVAPLVATANAVLLDARQAADPPPALWRRAAHVVRAEPAELAAFAATLPAVQEMRAT
jgi:hypothetical protein